MNKHGCFVFGPRKTGSWSIAKAWSLEHTPIIHTHDLLYMVVIDKCQSGFYKFVKNNFPKTVSFYSENQDEYIHYSIIIQNKLVRNSILKFFNYISIVTSIRDPITRRISQMLQSITIEQINAIMDTTYPSWKRLENRTPNVAELCHVYQKMVKSGKPIPCPLITNSLRIINSEKKLLSTPRICELFNKHFVKTNMKEFLEFFTFMQEFVDPDFNFDKIRHNGHDFQKYSILGINTTHMILKLENINDHRTKIDLKNFTGIKELSREHNSDDSHHIIRDDLKIVKNEILERYKHVELSKEFSIEGQLSKGFGY